MLIEQSLAVEAVQAVLSGRSLTPHLERAFARHANLDANQRAAVIDMAHGCLRHLGLMREVLARMLRKPLDPVRLEPLLLVALYQLAFTRAAPYAVVDHAVRATERAGWPWAKGLVNALLRRFLREREQLVALARSTPQGRYSYPEWWIDRLRAQYPERWEAILEAGNRRPGMALRVNARRSTRDDYVRLLQDAGIEAEPADDVGVLLARPMPVAQIPGFERGLVSVQDLGAQLAAPLLDARAGERVLDAFAAPGGKTAHILERTDVRLVALDSDPVRI